MSDAFLTHIRDTLSTIQAEGLMKRERLITSPQGGEIMVGARRVINLCANNYLGLADHPALIAAAQGAMAPRGFGMASVRFICGTQDIRAFPKGQEKGSVCRPRQEKRRRGGTGYPCCVWREALRPWALCLSVREMGIGRRAELGEGDPFFAEADARGGSVA